MKPIIPSGLICLIFLAACDSTRQDWADTQATGSIEAYQAFIYAHPKHVLADSARAALTEALAELKLLDYVRIARNIPAFREFTRLFPASVYSDSLDRWTDAIISERHPSLRAAEKATIRFSQDLGEAENARFALSDRIGPHLECAGLVVVEEADAEHDLLVDIQVFGRALSARYGSAITARWGIGGQVLYTGADISGTISLIVAGHPIMTKRFRRTFSPPEAQFSSGEDPDLSPSDAPFISTFVNGFYPVWMDLVDQSLGPSTLRGILEISQNTRNRARHHDDRYYGWNLITEKLIRYDTAHFLEYLAARQQREGVDFASAEMIRAALVSIGEPALETMREGLRAPSHWVKRSSREALQSVGRLHRYSRE